jgi:hypothetical protein
MNSILVRSFCFNSGFSYLKQEEVQQLFDSLLLQNDVDNLSAVIRAVAKSEYSLDLSTYLNRNLLKPRSILPAIICILGRTYHTFSMMTPDVLRFIRSSIGNDFISFVMNASGRSGRSIAIALISVDASYFAQQFLSLKRVKAAHLVNRLRYCGSDRISFPPDEFFSFVISMLTTTRSRRKQPLIRRLLSVFISRTSSAQDIGTKAANLLASDISGPQAMESFSTCELLELYYEAVAISGAIRCSRVVSDLSSVLKPTTTYGRILNCILQRPSSDQISAMLQSFVPSTNLAVFEYFARRCESDGDLSTSEVSMMCTYRPLRTSSTDRSLIHFLRLFADHCRKSKLVSRSEKRSLMRYCLETLSVSPNSASLQPVLMTARKMLPLLGKKSPELASIREAAERMFGLAIVPMCACMIMTHPMVASDAKPTNLFTPWLCCHQSYDSLWIAERAAAYQLGANEAASDVIGVVTIAKDFWVTFSAVAWLEKKVSRLKHESMKGMFPPAYDYALRLLEDKDVKAFAPMFAMVADPDSVPRELAEFVDGVKATKSQEGRVD